MSGSRRTKKQKRQMLISMLAGRLVAVGFMVMDRKCEREKGKFVVLSAGTNATKASTAGPYSANKNSTHLDKLLKPNSFVVIV